LVGCYDTPNALWRRLASLLVGVGVGLHAPCASFAAEPDPLQGISVDYAAPAGCGSQREVLAGLREALGANVDGLPSVNAVIDVTPSGSNYVLSFRAQKGAVESRRALVLDSCEAAREVSVLLLLLAVDPILAESLGASRVVEQAQAPAPPPAPVAEATPTQPGTVRLTPAAAPTPRLTRRAPSRPRAPAHDGHERGWVDGGWFALGGLLVSSVTPAAGFGVALEGGVRRAPFRVGASGGWARSLAATVDEVPGASLSASLLRAHLMASWELGPRDLRFGPVITLGVERVDAEVRGISAPTSGSTPLLSATAGGWLNLVVSRGWGLTARASALIPLEQPRFRVAGLREALHQPGPVGADVVLGVSWAWGSQSERAAATTIE
jgi:hypothetical protein